MTDLRATAQLPDSPVDAMPSGGYALTPLVAMSASPGTLGSIEALLAAVQHNCGLAFVILLQTTGSELAAALEAAISRATSMRVTRAVEATRLAPDTIHLLAPDRPASTLTTDGSAWPVPANAQRQHLAVDLFLRAFAETHGAHFAFVRLARAGGEGIVGLARLKERGGLLLAQDPLEGASDDPGADQRFVPPEGLIDMTLPLARIGPWLVRYFHFERRLRLRPSYRDDAPEYRGTTSSSSPSAPELDRLIDNLAFREVLGLLRSRTGCDFEPYKHVTMLRRIARRMQVQGSEDLRDYLQILGQQPDEAGALLQDLLVSASNFFREPAAFKALGARLPALFAGKGPRDVVRVWMAGCATGEEAYSVAMMLREHALVLDTSPLLRLVAHDLNSYALGQARAGFYAGMLDVDVIDDRLARFFTREAGGYRVRREIREMVVFLAHDLLEDPDLPSQDLVVCRNVLVYLGARARARVLQHIARVLRPAGLLMLGPQEALPEHHPHFVVVDRAHRLYARRSGDGTAGPDAGAT